MPVEACLQAIVMIHRLEVNVPLDGYHKEAESDPRDPCVWVLEGSSLGTTQRRYMRFFASEFIALLGDLKTLDLALKERVERVGAITHASELAHSLSFMGQGYFHYESGQTTDFEISFSPMWDGVSVSRLIDDVHRAPRDLGSAGCRQVHPTGGALCSELKTYIAELLARDRPRGFELNPVSIKREA